MQNENLHQPKTAEEIMKEVDRESNVRVFGGWRAFALRYGKIFAALFMMAFLRSALRKDLCGALYDGAFARVHHTG